MKIVILDRALGHIRDGSWFYEKQGRGLGIYFRTAILDDIKRLKKTFGVHKIVLGKYHRSISRRFPFAIYYRIEGGQIRIYAVLDSRRHPDWIRLQLN